MIDFISARLHAIAVITLHWRLGVKMGSHAMKARLDRCHWRLVSFITINLNIRGVAAKSQLEIQLHITLCMEY